MQQHVLKGICGQPFEQKANGSISKRRWDDGELSRTQRTFEAGLNRN